MIGRAAPIGAAAICVVIDLGDLHRSDHVARTLGPSYANGLAAVAERRILETLGNSVALYRIDVDCFAFILSDDGSTTLRNLTEDLIERLARPLDYDGLPGARAPHAGIARFTRGTREAEGIVLAAIAAALEARDTDTPWRMLDPAAEQPNLRLHGILSELPAALSSRQQLWIAYQPRIELRTGVCVGAEALLRWNHPLLGFIPPGEFIPVAEQTGMARFVTEWVLDNALQDLASWSDLSSPLTVSVNVSAVNLAENDFAERLGDTIRRHGIDPARLELEFTEAALIRDSERVRITIRGLVALGVGIAIDDFGTGYSNLAYLRDVTAHVLKIDQCFVRWLTDNDRDPIIVRAIIELGHSLGYRLVAEGIEDATAQSALTD
jgi:EAL domain-containing protein (putative c-di-GMP-specific phosphodiesterase class I)/GGDEF domain-containing protein